MSKRIIKDTIFFTVMFGVVSLVPPVLFTFDRYILIILYLVTIAIPLLWYSRKVLIPLLSRTKTYEAVALSGASLLLHVLTVYIIKNYAMQPTWPFDSKNTSFLLLNNYYIWAKPLDVFMQQLLIVLLVLRLKFYGLTIKATTWYLVVGFGVVHILQIFRTDFIIGLLFTASAILFSLVFPRNILKVRNGYIYNYMIHLAVYNIAALIAWFL